MELQLDFTGKTAVVTGAASGLGYLTSACLARSGASVVMVDVNADALKEKAAAIAAEGGRVTPATCDVRDYAQVEAVRETALATYGSVDILICCAGGAETRLTGRSAEHFWDVPIDVYDFGIDLNLKGAFYFDHAMMKAMWEQERGGVIVNLGSITGEEGCGTNVAYSASKSALMNGVVKSLAQAGKGKIRCMCVAPGPVLTRPGMAAMQTMAGRAAEPQEIVDMILFVASEKGAFLNGTTILMDGGRNVMRCKS